MRVLILGNSGSGKSTMAKALARVREYYARDDEYSHRKHTAVYEGFDGNKRRVS